VACARLRFDAARGAAAVIVWGPVPLVEEEEGGKGVAVAGG